LEEEISEEEILEEEQVLEAGGEEVLEGVQEILEALEEDLEGGQILGEEGEEGIGEPGATRVVLPPVSDPAARRPTPSVRPCQTRKNI